MTESKTKKTEKVNSILFRKKLKVKSKSNKRKMNKKMLNKRDKKNQKNKP